MTLRRFLERYLDPAGRDYDPQRNFYRYAPGTRFNYSNVGYALLGYLVEAVSGRPFDVYCRERIFEPLAMPRTSWRMGDLDPVRVAMPYEHRNGRYVPYGHYGYPDYPNGLLRSSVRELAHFAIAHLQGGRFADGRILKPRTVRAMHTVQRPEIASDMGLSFFADRMAGVPVVGHDGGDYGVSTQMWLSRPRRLAVVLLTNGDAELARETAALDRILRRLIEVARAAA